MKKILAERLVSKRFKNASGLFSMFMDSDDFYKRWNINIIHYLKLLIKFDYPLDIKGLYLDVNLKSINGFYQYCKLHLN